MTDEEYVRANWERAEVCETVTGPYLKWCISLGGRGFTRACIPDNWAMSESEAWAAAAEFTRGCLEQIRQLEREIVLVESVAMANAHYLHTAIEDGRSDDAGGMTALVAPWFRAAGRLETALADLKQGMR